MGVPGFLLAVGLLILASMAVLLDWYTVRRMLAKKIARQEAMVVHRCMLDKFYFSYLLAIFAASGIMLVHEEYDFSGMLSLIIMFVEATFLKHNLV